jgi:hypothetical protein
MRSPLWDPEDDGLYEGQRALEKAGEEAIKLFAASLKHNIRPRPKQKARRSAVMSPADHQEMQRDIDAEMRGWNQCVDELYRILKGGCGV